MADRISYGPSRAPTARAIGGASDRRTPAVSSDVSVQRVILLNRGRCREGSETAALERHVGSKSVRGRGMGRLVYRARLRAKRYGGAFDGTRRAIVPRGTRKAAARR